MADLNIQELRNPALRKFFGNIFDATSEVEGLAIQAEGVSVPIAFTASAPVNAEAATGTLTISDTVVDAETVTIGEDIYEFDTAAEATITEGNIRVDVSGGATKSAAVTALVAAINASATGDYTAADGVGDTVVVTYGVKGTVGNAIPTTEESTVCAWGATKLAGGIDGTIGQKGQMFADASYIYFAIADNTVSDANWRKVSLGSVY